MQAFANQWLHRPGWAELDVRASWNGANTSLDLVVTQEKFAPFAVPLTLLLRDDAGRERRVRVDIPALARQTISVPVGNAGRPAVIVADPDVLLLGRIRLEYR